MSLLATGSMAQSIGGHVVDENNDPVPFANVFVRELNTGTATDSRGRYFLTLDAGIYNLAVSAVGFQTQAFPIILRDKPLVKNITLKASHTELDEVVVKASRRDPAFEIIQRVVETKEKYIKQTSSSRTQVYVRAIETVDKKKKKEPTVTDRKSVV